MQSTHSRVPSANYTYSTVQRQLYKSTRGTRERHAGYARGTRRVRARDTRGHACSAIVALKKGRAAGTKDASRGRGGLLKCS